MTPLKIPDNHTCADQCREMGLVVGDVIQGREGSGDWWSESRLTLLFLGAQAAVFSEQRSSHRCPDWRDVGESGSWTLNCRQWHKVTP